MTENINNGGYDNAKPKTIRLLCFPWAGGTSRLYADWIKTELTTKTFSSASDSTFFGFQKCTEGNHRDSHPSNNGTRLRIKVEAVDYPGRIMRPSDPPLKSVQKIAQWILSEYLHYKKGDEKKENETETLLVALFGHSFGAIVAYEVARLLDSLRSSSSSSVCNKLPPVVAAFLSASRPPHASSLVSSGPSSLQVSQMDATDMMEYFKQRGNQINDQVMSNADIRDIFVQSVRLDYYCLETYEPNEQILSCPIFAMGGDEDPIVSAESIHAWRKHAASSENFASTILRSKGHYYLHDEIVMRDIAYSIYGILERMITAGQHRMPCEIAGCAAPRKEEEEAETAWKDGHSLVSVVTSAYRKVLQVDDPTKITPESNFFDLGGTSLDMMPLATELKTLLDGIRITQNEFFVHPTVQSLSSRIEELMQNTPSNHDMPSIVPTKIKGGEWFPASYGQEQMMSCWETSPTMYNMPTTIEFHGTVSEDSLRKAFLSVVKDQPSLRTVVRIFPTVKKAQQQILPEAETCFELTSINVLDEEEARIIIEKESVYQFDLAKPPIVRGTLVRVCKNAHSSEPDQASHCFLTLNQHHVGSDGWSRMILRRQILTSYLHYQKMLNEEVTENNDKNITADSPALIKHPNYIDWTLWSRKWLEECGQREHQIQYWTEKLRDLPPLELPLDHTPRPAVLSSRGARIPILVDRNKTERFKTFVESKGATLYTGLLSLYATLLHRWGGGNDFAIGIALANREHEGLGNVIGYFANEVAIRAQFDEDTTFIKVLHDICQNVFEGMANSDTPFHDVTDALNVVRDRSRTSVFQAMFALQEREWHTVDDLCPPSGYIDNDGKRLTFNVKQYNHNTSKFEVHMQLRHDGNGGLEGDFHIATDLFELSTGERMVEAFGLLLGLCLDSPDTSILSHDITPKLDKTLSKTSNKTSVTYEKITVLDMINSVDETSVAFVVPDATTSATSSKWSEVTFGEFRDDSRSICYFLIRSAGISKGDPVGVLMKNSSRTISVILGILMAGGTHVILDVDKTPLDRLIQIFEDANVKVILTDDDIDKEKAHGVTSRWNVRSWSDINQTYNNVNTGQLLHTAGDNIIDLSVDTPCLCGEDIFGIYYTSGTTGVPKGVLITMNNIQNLVCWWKKFFNLHSHDRILLFSSLSFIMSLRQYLPSLCAGAKVVVPRASVDFDRAVTENAVNKLVCTPSALAALDADKISCMDAVQVAGEPPQLNTMLKWQKIAKQLYIGLGPTELCAHGLCGQFDGKTLSIGHPADNVRAYIVDPRSGLEVPTNVVGDLWVAGANVSRGYLKDGSCNKFSTDPFLTNGDRIYKTGDLARRLSDGRIQFVGRKDSQIKVNGFRVEAGDIINAMPSEVSRAHVMVHDGRLVVFVTPKVDKNLVLSALKQTLPTYMIPSVLVPVEFFPLNKNRKLDTKTLLETSKDAMISDKLNTQKQGEMTVIREKILLIWSDLLKVHSCNISLQDNFFESGGTSLSAVVLARTLTEELQVDVSVQDIFANQSLESQCELLTELESNSSFYCSDPSPPLVFLPGGNEPMNPYFFSIAQGLGLVLMSLIVAVPTLATIFLCTRSFIWFGTTGFLLFPCFLAAGCTIHMMIVMLCKWLVIGRFTPGKAKVFSWIFLKWWLIRRVLHVTRLYTWVFDETRFSNLWLTLLGANVGKNISVEQPYLLEPDLVSIGNDCVLEFEVQFATSEIRNNVLEFRPVSIGNRVKLGVRSVLLGGSKVHDGCEVEAKSILDHNCSSTNINQVISGAPAKATCGTCGDEWRPNHGRFFSMLQIFGIFLQLLLMSAIAFAGIQIGFIIQDRHGNIFMVAYLASIFTILSSLLFLASVAMLRRVLLPNIIPGVIYGSSWFALRKWFIDRLLLSPIFTYSSQRMLQTSSTFPWYLGLFGARIGKKPWMNHPYFRVGSELIEIGDDFHMGMLSYMSTETYSKDGVSFQPLTIGNQSSFGQRCVALGGAHLEDNCTVGAETLIPRDFNVISGGTIFGSPPVAFKSAVTNENIIQQLQDTANVFVDARKHGERSSMTKRPSITQAFSNASGSLVEGDDFQENQAPARRQDIGQGKMFWSYVVTMILIQGMLPFVIGGSYGSIYYAFTLWFGELRFEYFVAAVPLIYMAGTLVLMLTLKLMQLVGGSFSIGTTNFFSLRFFYWHIFADMIYLCTSSIIYPLSGTQLYCSWLRFMGAKVGRRVFISPENGGFREIDFFDIGNDAILMTPNIHAHYTDHGMLQFCPIKLEDRVEINAGATIMPLTCYMHKSRLRPFTVTVKGQTCESKAEYFGNPAKKIKLSRAGHAAVVFPGQGTQYPGMLQDLMQFDFVQKMVQTASEIVQFDIAKLCAPTADTSVLQDTVYSQPLIFVTSLAAAEVMRLRHPLSFSKVVACAGFSLGELTALCFSGAISFEDALGLVKVRAEAMARCNGGAMCNIRGISEEKVKELCKETGCTIANIICNHLDPNHVHRNLFACAGTSQAVDKLMDIVSQKQFEDDECATTKKLRVSGAFHSDQMIPAQKSMRHTLKSVDIHYPDKVLVYSNVTGKPYQSANQIRSLLTQQMVKPVRWHCTIKNMQSEGINQFIECGPMQTISKTISAIQEDIESSSVQIMSSDE